MLVLFFFFKQKTAYEVRISDWSSDVCSSDLREDHRLTVLKSTVVGKNVYYAACERVADADGARIVFAVVCLVRYTPRARDGYIFAYKDMDETVGPCASKCPASILSLLTPTESQWANAWRERCRTVIAARSTDTAQPDRTSPRLNT